MHIRAHRLALVLLLVGLSACVALKVRRTAFGPGPVLILPARDVVQLGRPHLQGAGSGNVLSGAVARGLAAHGWQVMRTTSTRFDDVSIVDRTSALDEGRQLGAHYVLQLVLGEFRNAAPMSFRDDFVVLEQGTLWEVETGNEVWVVSQPLRLAKENIGGHMELIEAHAELIVKSLTQQ